MASSDRRIDIVKMGNSNTGELILVAKDGQILLYDGYMVSKWRNAVLPLPNQVESVYLKDSLLYFTTKDALLLFNPKSKKPQLLQKCSNKFFLKKQEKLLLSADNEWFEIEAGKLNKINSQVASIRLPEYIELETGESIRIQNDLLVWSDHTGRIISTKRVPESTSILLDHWNQLWLLNNLKLFKLDLIRKNENSKKYFWKDQAPISITSKGNLVLASYAENQIVLWTNNSPSLLWNTVEGVLSLHIEDQGGSWVVSKNMIYFANQTDKFSWNRKEVNILGELVSILHDGTTVSFVTRNNGIIQTRPRSDQEDWIWIPYRYNTKVKNLKLIKAAYRDKIYLFSESFGVFVLDKDEVSIIKKNFPSLGLYSVQLEREYAFLMDKGKRFHQFSFGRKSIINYTSSTRLPEPADYNFISFNDQVIYSTKTGLCLANPLTEYFEIFNTVASVNRAIVTRNTLSIFGDIPQTFQLPNAPTNKPGPSINQVTLKTKSGIEHLLTQPISGKLKLTNEDFPIQLQASCNYLNAPKKIEYAWKTEDGDIINDFQFSNSIKLRLSEVPIQGWKIITKVDEAISERALRPIKISYLSKKPDYRWAIYLSIILALLLLAILIFNKWRSQIQKRKIQTLKLEKKALELEQKALQLQLNPHFVFNALNGVKGMIALGDAKKARHYLTKISALMRTMLNDARTDKISINSEVNMLTGYLEIEQELRDFPWKFEVKVEESLNGDLLIPPMMIQPFVENAIIHAFPRKNDAGLISVSFSKRGPKIQVEIEDNGVGLQTKESAHQSVALQLIQDRLKHLNEGTKQSDFTLTNKEDQDANDHGVIVTLLLPILS